MKCPNCRTKYDGAFCPQCGTPARNDQPGYPLGNQKKPKKSIFARWWFWLIVVIVGIGVIANLGNNGKETKETMANPSESSSQTVDNSATVNAIQTSISPSEEENLSSIETTYTLTSGHYFAGTDIPIGKCNVTAIDGSGNLSSTNLFNGGVNEMFGVDDGSGFYTSNFNGLKLPMDTVLNVSGGLTIKLEYTSIDGGFSGRIYNDANAITLTSGNYEAGTDFSEGIYKVVAVSGSGNLSSSNLFDGGVNEMFGVDDGSGLYTQDFINVVLSKKVELTVTGGLTIKLIPATSP